VRIIFEVLRYPGSVASYNTRPGNEVGLATTLLSHVAVRC